MGMKAVFAHLELGESNDELVGRMVWLKGVRERYPGVFVACTIRGFGGDRRELYAIPEVRGFCRRLVALGFISYLDVTTTLPGSETLAPAEARGCWGAAEVWLCSEGLTSPATTWTPELLDRVVAAVETANWVADRVCGPFAEPAA